MMSENGLEGFLFEKGRLTFLHTTSEVHAKEILQTGLVFEEYLTNTMDCCNPTAVDVNWLLTRRKPYGAAVVVASITAAEKMSVIEEISLSEAEALMEDNEFDSSFQQYLLPPTYIKGYFLRETGRIVKNEHYRD